MSKRTGVAVAALLGVLAIGAGVARAGMPTEIVADASGALSDDPDQSYFVGHLTSANPKCLAGRKVKILFGYKDSPDPRLVDTDRTSKRGAFAGDGRSTHATAHIVFIRVIVAKKNIRTKNHPKICASFQDDFG